MVCAEFAHDPRCRRGRMQPLPSPELMHERQAVTAVPPGIVERDLGGTRVSVLPLAMFTSRGPTAPRDWHKDEYKTLRRTMIAKM